MDTQLKKNAEKEKQNEPALVTAVSCHDIFELDSNHMDSVPLPKGSAFAFIKTVQVVNEKLADLKETEKVRFEVILLGKNCEEQIKSSIFDSAKFYGLEISKFYFCSRDDFIRTLEENHIKLYLSTDRDDVYCALQAGIPAALLCQQANQQVLDQLKLLFSGDLIGLPGDSTESLKDLGFSEIQIQSFKAVKGCMREFAVRIGKMRKRFGCEGSPLRASLVTAWGSRDTCAVALKTLRDWGLDVDEAYCLAGAPSSHILNLVQPHILWDDGLHHLKGVCTLKASS